MVKTPNEASDGVGVERDNLDEMAATIWMANWCRGVLMIAGLIVARKGRF